MESKEYDGIIKLIETNHGETIRRFDDVDSKFTARVDVCRKRLNNIDDTIIDHGKSLTRVKTVGVLAGSLWTAIVLFCGTIFR